MTSETYPSVPGATDRRTVTYGFDLAGRLGYLNSNATSYAPLATVTNITYASHNALNTETYGNSLVHAVTYNNRLQASEIKLGTSGAPTSVLDLVNNYGTTNNNGNVLTESYVGGGLSYTQNFGYDQLNRLTTSNENGGASWSQTNGYDQYGNRWIDYGGGVHNLAFSTSNNRITTAGFSYDAAGNLTNDTIHAYTFDAEDKIKTVDAVTAYAYDGEGHRVRKFVGENTRFVYGIGGQLIAEFDGVTGNLKKEYLYGGATLITIEPTAVNSNGTQYTTSDNLGSPRVITNSSGSVVSRHDFMPFGEELCAGTGGRTTGMGFCAGGDTNRKKFTGYERDTETGLDFAQGRYFSSTQGRFTSADSLLGSLANPQTLNRYAYVGNNPLNFSDPTGRMAHQTTISSSASSNPGWGWDDPGSDPESILPDEVRQDMRAWEQRVQNTRDSLAASDALANNDFDRLKDILNRNPNVGVSVSGYAFYGQMATAFIDGYSQPVEIAQRTGIPRASERATQQIRNGFNAVARLVQKRRAPDFYMLDGGALNLDGSLALTRDCELVISVGGSAGSQYEISITAGWLLQLTKPSSQDVLSFLTGPCTTGMLFGGPNGIGAGVGGGFMYSNWNKGTQWAVLTGVGYGGGVSVSVGYSWQDLTNQYFPTLR